MAQFKIYADLMSLLAEIDTSHGKTHLYQTHKCSAASAVIRSLKVAAIDGKFCFFTGNKSAQAAY